MGNRNSFAENLSQLVENTKDILEIANGLNSAMTGNSAEVNINDNITLPSYYNIVKRVERAENTISKFTQGKGIVETDDGTFRKIKVDTISHPADTISGLSGVNKFTIDPNWFFELFQYPRCVVNVDLTGKIDDDSDRVYVNRIIIDSTQDSITDTIKSDILSSTLSYKSMIDYLDLNKISYKEDRDEVKLPLTYEKYFGEFRVTGSALIKNENKISQLWYYLSTINYSLVDENGAIENDGYLLNVGDKLRFENSLYNIAEINQIEKRVRLDYAVGYETIGTYDTLEFYNQPFSEKVINVGIGINEIDIVYIKGVNENYNLLSKSWSNPIIFYTNDLVFSENTTETFEEYYRNNVADFGKELIAQAKDRRVYSYDGLVPNTPTVNKDDLKVVQINTQLNTTLDTKKYNELTSEIASTKSNISSMRSVISSNKNKLLQESDSEERTSIQNLIESETEKLNTFTTQFSSLVEELNTLLVDAGTISYSPKYHIRGFFSIPEPKYLYDKNGVKRGKQSIIGFETMYRYIHTDNTGVDLNTFKYTDNTTGATESVVFSDWNLTTSQFLEKEYNSDSGIYEWVDETIDGTSININKIDIPIRSGEKVEIKVRSISEAGYPYNPIKSSWSNSVIMEFPDSLTSDDSVTTILNTVKNDMTAVTLQETLSAAGMYTHISDTNSKYKHSADNIEYTEVVADASGVTSVVTMSLADKIRSLSSLISGGEQSLENVIVLDTPIKDASGNIVATQIKISMPNDKYMESLSDASSAKINEKIYNAIEQIYDKISKI